MRRYFKKMQFFILFPNESFSISCCVALKSSVCLSFLLLIGLRVARVSLAPMSQHSTQFSASVAFHSCAAPSKSTETSPELASRRQSPTRLADSYARDSWQLVTWLRLLLELPIISVVTLHCIQNLLI